MTLEELKKLYAEKGATEQRVTPSEQGDIVDYIPVQLGEGWTAGEKDNRKIVDYIGQGMDATPVYDDAKPTLSGFSKQEGDYITDYDLNGNPIARRKWNESDLKTMWNDLGPIAMAALSGYLGGIPLGETGLTAGNVLSGAKAIQNKDVLGLLSSGAGGIDTGGIDIGGLSASDLMKYAGIANSALSGDPSKIIRALPGLTSSLGGFDANPNDFTEGYFLPGGEGYIDPMSKTQGVTGPGYYDEITGEYVKSNLGGLRNPLGPETGNIDPTLDWEYNQTSPNVWTDKDGNVLDMSYLPNSQTALTGKEIMDKAGVSPAGNKINVSNPAKTAIPAKSANVDLSKLLGLLAAAGGQQTVQAPSQDPYAHIKLMEDIFGPTLDLTPAGDDTAKRK